MATHNGNEDNKDNVPSPSLTEEDTSVLMEKIADMRARDHQPEGGNNSKQGQGNENSGFVFFGRHNNNADRSSNTDEIERSGTASMGSNTETVDATSSHNNREDLESVLSSLNKIATMKQSSSVQRSGELQANRQLSAAPPGTSPVSRLGSPGAFRVAGRRRNRGETMETMNEAVSNEMMDNNNVTLTSITAVESTREQARIRQEIIQQSPQGIVILNTTAQSEDNSNDSNRQDPWFTRVVIFGLVAVGFIFILFVVVVVMTHTFNNQNLETGSDSTIVSTIDDTTTDTQCPCTFDPTLFLPQEENAIMIDAEVSKTHVRLSTCGPLHLQVDELLPGQFGAGICEGAGCAEILPDLSRGTLACFLVRKMTTTDTLQTIEQSTTILNNKLQEESCRQILSTKCRMAPLGGGRHDFPGGGR